MYGSAGHRVADVAHERRSRQHTFGVVSMLLGGLACAALLAVVGVWRQRQPQVLYETTPWGSRQQTLFSFKDPRRIRATLQSMSENYMEKWASNLDGSSDFQSMPSIDGAGMTMLGGTPVCYPSYVKDLSGRLHRDMPLSQLRAIQHPLFNVVPESHSQKLACRCESCEPQAGFPPVCTGCNCEEIQAHPDLWFLGHTQACTDKDCKDLAEGPAPAGGGGGGADNSTAAAGGGADSSTAADGNATAGEGEGGGHITNALGDWPECEFRAL